MEVKITVEDGATLEDFISDVTAQDGAAPLREREVLSAIAEWEKTLTDRRRQIYDLVKQRKKNVENAKALSITPEMALRLGKALDSRPGFWMDMQAGYDMWQVKHLKPGFLDRIGKIAATL